MAAFVVDGLAALSRFFSFSCEETRLTDKLWGVFCPLSPSLPLFFFLTLFWFYVHAFVSPRLPALLLPASARRQHIEKVTRIAALEAASTHRAQKTQPIRTKQGVASYTVASSSTTTSRSTTACCSEDASSSSEAVSAELAALRVYFISANANTTASLHALYLTPAALFHAVRCVVLPAAQILVAQAASQAYSSVLAHASGSEAEVRMQAEQAALHAEVEQRNNWWDTYFAHWGAAADFWDGRKDPLVIFSSYMMGSYFLWDCFECLRNLEVHKRAFLFHALLSFLAGTIQITAPGIKLSGLCSLFAASEISTPFLHFRWFLVQNGQAHTTLFRFINALTVFLFISVRLIVVPYLVFWHYWVDCLLYRHHMIPQKNISTMRMVFMMVLTLGWTLLNYFWGYLFFRSLCRHRKRSGKNRVEKDADTLRQNEGGKKEQ
ncbi:TLC domain protein [Toxoplasma gondii TgCatPRC2]|uniref:TLC domain protein n=3 Tax=Toxoplasma gondii TaxID=5811 RepID=A0A151HRY7_TOXGO|nr:hypothetical protein TGME49_243760 [Toxoplasma gondii ME49]EPT30504.1 hypothetical protein TGME49_243760 [Toxoplasma gondii ME49]KYF41008.1 TLC domain protein [Toxoplasma gondii ARI]KYK72072.1 TLC domain protein [Toxoplasma gondii TgCatPRC2]|eukprot:XP_002366875.1 hypothetical protein TGME49_243760 [Toxoplasma gondii ME49]